MDFRVLGQLEVVGAEGPAPLGGPKQRAVLAHLLVRANKLVPTDALIDALWGDEPPEAARGTLQAYVSNLRKALGPSRIEGRAPGYLLRVDPDEVDAMRFEALVRDARRLGAEPSRAAAILSDALALWRGPPFADLDGNTSLQGEVARLEELRLGAIEERIGAELAAGRHDELVAELEPLVRDHPLRERLWAHLMLALYRSGRQAEALAACERARECLAEELRIDLSPELRRLHEQVLRQDPELELRGRPLRGYRLLERIGEGAFGVVHRALQPQVGREVAVKSIHAELANDPEFVRRFEREAQLVARLEHPHVVPLYDYWRDAQGAYLVMRYLRGGNLRARIEGETRLSPDEVAATLDQVAQALAAAHRQGVVHRDVKPENVLLDEEGNAYLSDFGIAKDLAESPTTRSGMRGTPAYLSPEQIRGEPVSPSCDVYALGIVLYEALTGRHPFPDGSLATLMQRHLHDPVPSLVHERPELSSGVDEVIGRATAKDPGLRYADAPALAAAFRQALGTFAVAVSRPPALEVTNPYKGLRAFDEADAPDFFGRERLTHRLVKRLSTGPGSRLVAVVGPSGSGKSSVVRAGLVPALRGGAVAGSGDWFFAEMTPGAQPFEELEAALLRIAINPPSSLMEQLERDERGLLRVVKRVLPEDDSELLLFVDQFEELFTLTDEDNARNTFLDSLATAVTDPRSQVCLVLTLRADFYDRPLLHPAFGELLGPGTETVTPLAPDELERAISGPAERMGITPEPALVAEMVADVADEPGALPQLQFALMEAFDRRRDRTLTLAAYHEIGGVSGALVGRAEELFGALDDDGREACRQLFLRLVALGEGTEDTRRRVAMAELDALEVDREAMDRAVELFGRHRLLSFDRDPATRGPTVELAHEALLRAWDRPRGWIDAAREDVMTVRRLTGAATEWELSGREPSFLLRGSRLDLFESWADRSHVAIGRSEHAYLRASVTQREDERAAEAARLARERALERRSVKRLRALVALLAAAALVAGSLTAVAANRNATAQRAARLATARELAGAGLRTIGSDAELATLLALESIEATAEDGIVAADAELVLREAIPQLSVESLGGSLEVSGTPDVSRVAIVGETGPTAVWEFAAGQPGRRVFTVPTVLGSPRECSLAVGGERFPTCDAVFHAALSPDGSLLATGHGDRSVRVWEVDAARTRLEIDTYEELPPVSDPPGVIAPGVGFSPDGRYLWTQARYGSLIVWDLATTAEVVRAPDELEIGLPQWPHGNVAFSDDGRFVAFGGLSTQIWDLETREVLVDDPELSFSSPPISFSRNGLASDGLSLWDLDDGGREPLPDTPQGPATHLGFSPDGRRLAIVTDTTVLVWDVGSQGSVTLAFSGEPTSAMAWSPDSASLATGGADGTVEIWDVSSGRVAVTIPTGPVEVMRLAFTPDGERLAIAADDGTVSLHIVRLADLIELARDRLSRELTDEECQRYLHVRPCPTDE